MDIESLRKICLGFKGSTEDIKWEKDLCFCVGHKMFCVTCIDQPFFSASLKVMESEFNELVERQGIIPAPYLARHKWVKIEEADALKKAE